MATSTNSTTIKTIRDRLQACRDKLPKLQVNIPSRPTHMEGIAEEPRKPKKKALLIGVQYITMGEHALKGPHKDVAAMRKLLIEKYQYNPKDIVVLIDSKDSKQKQPTHDNMVAEMRNLVQGAAPGDRFFFHYAGHATQVHNKDRKEEDGMDECIVPCDSNGSPEDPKLIKDDFLREILVDALPTGSHLVAIFDSCHSASLLDLKHFRCNRVYVPWMSKGRRKSDSMWLDNVRKNALVNTRTIHQTSRMSKDMVKTRKTSVDRIYEASEKQEPFIPPTPASHVLEFPHEHHDCEPVRAPSPPRPQLPVISTEGLSPSTRQRQPSTANTRGKRRQSTKSFRSSFTPWLEERPGQEEVICESPVEEFCSGSCRGHPSPIVNRRPTVVSGKSPVSLLKLPLAPANVISLGSCKDSQLAWEDLEGSSMTQTLVDILSRDPNPTLTDFMTKLSHTMHDRLLNIHTANKEYKRKKKLWRLKRSKKASAGGDTKGLEINNFQDPQLSSHKPLDMNTRLVL